MLCEVARRSDTHRRIHEADSCRPLTETRRSQWGSMATRQRQRQRRSGSGRSLVLGLRLRAGCGLTSAIACSIIPSSLSQPSSVSFSSSATQREEGGVRSRTRARVPLGARPGYAPVSALGLLGLTERANSGEGQAGRSSATSIALVADVRMPAGRPSAWSCSRALRFLTPCSRPPSRASSSAEN